MLLGEQSVTGKAVAVGDIVGISGLAVGQNAIANQLGSNHSDTRNKFEGLQLERNGNAILIPGARTKMICEVMEVMHLKTMEADAFVIVKVISFEQNMNSKFLGTETVIHG